MIYSSACAYAIRALSRMVMLRPEQDGNILLDELCEGTDLPRHFVAKIFQTLVREGLLRSSKGRGGGFALAKPASKITLYEIVAVVDGTDQFEQCVVGMAKCSDRQPCPLHDRWKGIRVSIREYLETTTLDTMGHTLTVKLAALEGGPGKGHA